MMKNELDPILVVDDNEMNLDLMAQHLEDQEYEFMLADGGKKALELAQDNIFSLVLLDLMMPQVSGMDVLRSLRKNYSKTDLPIIMVTASGDSKNVIATLDCGANDYITKPVDYPVLFARIQMHLSCKQQMQKFKEKKQFLALTLLSISDAVITVDLENKITLMNPTAEKITGWSVDETEGKNVQDIVNIVDKQNKEKYNVFENVLRSGIPEKFAQEVYLVSKDGNEYPVAGNISPVGSHIDGFYGFVLVMRNVSENQSV